MGNSCRPPAPVGPEVLLPNPLRDPLLPTRSALDLRSQNFAAVPGAPELVRLTSADRALRRVASLADGRPEPGAQPVLTRSNSGEVGQLIRMGFQPDAVAQELASHNGDINGALDALLARAHDDSAVTAAPREAASASTRPSRQVWTSSWRWPWGTRPRTDSLTRAATGDDGLCIICLVESGRKRRACGHVFCISCWRQYLESRIDARRVLELPCPGAASTGGCPSPLVAADEVATAVSSENFSRYTAFLHAEAAERDPNTRWCPRADCNTVCSPWVYEPPLKPLPVRLASYCLALGLVVGAGALASPDMILPCDIVVTDAIGLPRILCTITFSCAMASLLAVIRYRRNSELRGPNRKSVCPKCASAVCFDCKEEWHPGRLCDELAVAMVAQWCLSTDGGQCPNCGAFIERNQGCNHMKCRCGHEFCWLCGKRRGTCKCPQYHGRRDQDYLKKLGNTSRSRAIVMLQGWRTLQRLAHYGLRILFASWLLQLLGILFKERSVGASTLGPSPSNLQPSEGAHHRDAMRDEVWARWWPAQCSLFLQLLLGLVAFVSQKGHWKLLLLIGRDRDTRHDGEKILVSLSPAALPYIIVLIVHLLPTALFIKPISFVLRLLPFGGWLLAMISCLPAMCLVTLAVGAITLQILANMPSQYGIDHKKAEDLDLVSRVGWKRRLTFELRMWLLFAECFVAVSCASWELWFELDTSFGPLGLREWPWVNPVAFFWGARPFVSVVTLSFALFPVVCFLEKFVRDFRPQRDKIRNLRTKVVVYLYLFVVAPVLACLVLSSMLPDYAAVWMFGWRYPADAARASGQQEPLHVYPSINLFILLSESAVTIVLFILLSESPVAIVMNDNIQACLRSGCCGLPSARFWNKFVDKFGNLLFLIILAVALAALCASLWVISGYPSALEVHRSLLCVLSPMAIVLALPDRIFRVGMPVS